MRGIVAVVMLALLTAQAGRAVAGSVATDGPRELAGPVEVIDGDTLMVGGKRVRLYGIDAPEMTQYCATKHQKPYLCGRPAARTLRLFLGGAHVRCERKGQLPDGTILARCYAGRNDLAAQMVMSGWALADPVTGAEYRRGELAARATNDGLFKGSLVPPWDWRAGKREIAPGLPWRDDGKQQE